MYICEKCGNIYIKKTNSCLNCGNNNLIESDSCYLKKYKCENCGSLYRFRATSCNNCGSHDITAFNDGRQIVHTPFKYNIDKATFLNKDYSKESNNSHSMSSILNVFIILELVFAAIIVGINGYINAGSVVAPILPPLIMIFAFIAYRLNKDRNDARVLVIIFSAISTILTIVLLFNMSFEEYKFIFVAILIALLLKAPMLIKMYYDKIQKAKANKKWNSLQSNGLLFKNMSYDVIPDNKGRYYIQVRYSMGNNGIENMIQSKESFSSDALKDKVNLLIDTTDLNNFYIYFE